MNERVMQFRIGLFVLGAGIALVMMIFWFGESPTLFRDQVFVKVHYLEAPGVGEGIPVRRSGIKIGEVRLVEFDERANEPEGVLVTLALDRKAKLKVGTTPRIMRALIGDVSIEMMPSGSTAPLVVGNTVATAPVIEGDVSPDPAAALAAATKAFERVGGTLAAIEDAAKGVGKVAKRVEGIDEFIATWTASGKNLGSASARLDAMLKNGGDDVAPTVANLRSASEKFNRAFDDKTIAELKATISRLSSASSRLEAGLADIKPLLADLGAPITAVPTTNFGQTVWRANRITSDVGLLTRALSDGQGNLNPNGSIQRLFLSPALYDNWNKVAVTATEVVGSMRPVVASIREFVDRVKRDPSALTRGALQRE